MNINKYYTLTGNQLHRSFNHNRNYLGLMIATNYANNLVTTVLRYRVHLGQLQIFIKLIVKITWRKYVIESNFIAQSFIEINKKIIT